MFRSIRERLPLAQLSSTVNPSAALGPRGRSRKSRYRPLAPPARSRRAPTEYTDGRGGDLLKRDTPVAVSAPPPAGRPITLVEDSKPEEKQSTEQSSRKTKHAARERPAKVHKHRTVRKKRERPSMYASGYPNRSYFGYGGHVTYGWGGYGRAYGWSQW